MGIFRISTKRGTVEGDVGEGGEVERGGVGGRCVDAVRKGGLEERMARSSEGVARIRSIRGRSTVSSGGTSSSGSSVSGRGLSSGGVSSNCSGGRSGCSMISTSIISGGVGDSGGSGSASRGSRVSKEISGGGSGSWKGTGRRKVIGDGSGNRVCTIRLLLTG